MTYSLVEKIVALIRETSSSLPEDVLKALKAAHRKETKGSSAAVVLKTILDNCAIAAKRGTPLCQDTGTLTFFVDESLRRKVTPSVLKRAVAEATVRGYLRKNTIDSVTGRSYDDNVCEGAPVVHYVVREDVSAPVRRGAAGTVCSDPRSTKHEAQVTLILKGGGSENMSRQYSLPDATLGAGRDLAGVRKCVLDAVQKIQGYGCAPGILGVCIGGDRATGYEVAKEQLLRPLDEAENRRIVESSNCRMKAPGAVSNCAVRHLCGVGQQTVPSAPSPKGVGQQTVPSAPSPKGVGQQTVPSAPSPKGAGQHSQTQLGRPQIRRFDNSNDSTISHLERQLLREANSLGIGPMGLGGKTTLLGVKVAARSRLPASFFVTIAYMCWACRRRTITL